MEVISTMKDEKNFIIAGGQKKVLEESDSLPQKKTSFKKNLTFDVEDPKISGIKDETFFNIQPWLDSDCEDDFFSVNGDFTKSTKKNEESVSDDDISISIHKHEKGLMKELVWHQLSQPNISISDTNENIKDVMETVLDTEERGDGQELYFNMLRLLLESRDLYCANCKSCITNRVIIRSKSLNSLSLIRAQGFGSTQEQKEVDKFLCSSCFDFHIPKGGQSTNENFNHITTSKSGTEERDEDELYSKMLHMLLNSRNLYCPNCHSCVNNKLIIRVRHAIRKSKRISPASISKPEEAKTFSCLSCLTFFIPKANRRNGTVAVTISSNQKTETLKRNNTEGKWWETVLECIMIGGLYESITSLIIVTSAATANIPNGNIVALAFTNLITGLFIIRHNVGRVLKTHKLKMGPGGDILHYLIHFTVTILSFLIFGMVPLLVYAFTFRDKNLKLATMMGASLFCIALLAILKAHLQKPKDWVFYNKTLVCFVSIGIVSFSLSYFIGDLFGKLVQKLD